MKLRAVLLALLLVVSVLSFALFVFSSNTVSASITPYEVVGNLAKYDTNYYWVLDIRENDTFLISITPDRSVYYSSAVLYPNLTQVEPVTQKSGSHAYESIATVTGNYLLKIWSSSNGFDYTVKSSHEILEGVPYHAIGKVQGYETTWHDVCNVGKNEAVLISIAPDRSVYYSSAVLYPNLTQVEPVTQKSGSHAYESIATVTGNYLLKIESLGDAFNYTIKCSHYVTSEPPVPDFSMTSSPDTLIVEIGSSTDVTITVYSHMGYASDVSLNGSYVPTGVFIVIAPVLVTLPPNGQASSTLTVNAGLSAELGTAILHVTGKSGDLSRSCRISLTVREVEDRLPSSISCYLNTSQITYTQNVLISALLEPPMSTGTLRIQSTRDNATWDDVVIRVPSEGQCDHIWVPDAGIYFIRAKWSGDYNYLPCISVMRKLIVDKKSTILTIALLTNIAEPGQYVTANASIFPALPTQSIMIQCSTTNGSWQNLAAGLTDQTGSFTYTWLPEEHTIFWIRSTWSGSDNYEGDSSKPTVLIVETGHPTIATHIEIGNTTLEFGYKENVIVPYDVIDANSNMIKKDSKTLSTSSVGTFDLWIVFLGNETHKSCFYNANYTVTAITTKIENVRIISEYSPNLVELLFEHVFGTLGENKTYEGCAAYVAFDVRRGKSGDLIHECSLKLDTSTIGYNYVDLTYEGNETHKAAPTKSFRYKVLERVPIVTAIQMVMAVLIPIATLLIGWRSGLWRSWWQRLKKQRERKKTSSENDSDRSSGNEKLQQPEVVNSARFFSDPKYILPRAVSVCLSKVKKIARISPQFITYILSHREE